MFTLYRIASWGHKKVSGIVSRHQRDAASLRYREIEPNRNHHSVKKLSTKTTLNII